MKKIILLSSIVFALGGCKVSPDGLGGPGKGGGGKGNYEKGDSRGKEYFDAPMGFASHGSLDGLWRGQSETKSGKFNHEALFFDGTSTLLLAAKCRTFGLEAYSLVRAPIQMNRSKITITKTVGRYGVAKDETTGQKFECLAELQKGTFYTTFTDDLKVCLSSKANCKGSKEIYEKIRDQM